MMIRQPLLAALVLALAGLPCAAADQPAPKLFHGMPQGKGQWRMEVLEGTGMPEGRKPPTMTICTDNLAKQSEKSTPKPDPSCTRRVVKDTASEAVIETTCKGRTTVVTMKRESDKSVLMEMASSGGNAPARNMKMRYTSLGACRANQGGVTFDPDSEQCRKIKAAIAGGKMPPDQAAKLGAMCN